MRAISVMQPWADAILYLGKSIENRTWYTNHRGSLALHIGKGWDAEGEKFLRYYFKDWTPARAKAMRGGFFGLMWIAECVSLEAIETKEELLWGAGPWCWRLGNGTTFPKACLLDRPIPWRGQLGLFPVPLEHLGIFEMERSKALRGKP